MLIYITLGFALYFFYLALTHGLEPMPAPPSPYRFRSLILAIWCAISGVVMLYYSGFIPGHGGHL